MNALAVMQGHLSAHNGLHQASFMPVSQSLSSSSAPEFFVHGNLLPPNDFPSRAIPQSSAADPRSISASAHEFNSTVPTILETPQSSSAEDMMQNLQAVGYAVQEPNMVTAAMPPEDPLAFRTPYTTDFVTGANFPSAAAMHDFNGPFGELPQDLSQSFGFPTFMQTTASPAQSMEHSLSLMESSQSLNSIPSSGSIDSMPSLTTPYSNANWSEESNSSHNIATSSPPSDLDSSCNELPASLLNDMWQSGQPQKQMYQQSNPSVPGLSTSPDDYASQLGAPEFPSEAFARRNSSTSALVDSLNSVGLHGQPDSESTVSDSTQPSSIATRRQRPRPAALGAASLRSVSYTNGMPVSPGATQNLAAPDQQLRRIRSSGLASGGRIQKPSAASGQRSPLNFTFAEAAVSPKFVRHASMHSNVSSPTVSITASSLAPPTPSTPNDFAQWPPWQAPVPKVFPSGEPLNPNGVAVSWGGSGMGNPLLVNVSSPPDTPLDADQAAQFRAYMQHQQSMNLYRDTPPQSAPATQQSFSQTSMMPPSTSLVSHSMDDKMSHLRRPSLPDGAHAVPLRTLNCMQQWQMGVPMFNAAGDLQLSQPLHCDIPNRVQQPSPPQHFSQAPPAFGNQFTSSPHQPSAVKPDFPVHQYSPPQSNGTASPPRSDSMAPKVYHFNNAGPGDFQAKVE